MHVMLQQLQLPDLQTILAQPDSFHWSGLVHPGALPPPFVLQRARAMVSSGGPTLWWLPFLIVDQADQSVVGGCAFKGPPQCGRVEVLYGVSRHCRGRGLASAAVRELAAVAFAHGAAEVLAEIEPQNAGSLGVVVRCGFKREGVRTADDGVVVEQWVLARI